jgi:hypothetical protein
MRDNSFSGKVNRWALLNDNVKAYSGDLPQQIGPLQAQLEDLLGQARDLENAQEIARSILLGHTHLKQEVVRDGERVRAQMAALLRGTLGYSNEKLIQFGLRARTFGRRRKSPEAPPVTEITTPQS